MLRIFFRTLDAAEPVLTPGPPPVPTYYRADQDPEAGTGRQQVQRFLPDLPTDDEDLDFAGMLPVPR